MRYKSAPRVRYLMHLQMVQPEECLVAYQALVRSRSQMRLQMTLQISHPHEGLAACLANAFRIISAVRGQVLLQFETASERFAALKAHVPKIGSVFEVVVAFHGYPMFE